ncbi:MULTISPECIES: hypothetical protein [unclassified Adlercreutzia]|uniref:hypothetical protein n=1 Tax=unclassified Adlercreutzia TaxID=2636013 RepID=UPI0013EE023F|nr:MULTISPECIES: hypothetical protein [unclassified Adlercreutzia]
MKYEITHTCGCTETIELYGPGSKREYIIKQEESCECLDCFEARHHLPELEGSEKQIAWARDIRRGMVSDSNADKAIAITSAKAWIDGRDRGFDSIYKQATMTDDERAAVARKKEEAAARACALLLGC